MGRLTFYTSSVKNQLVAADIVATGHQGLLIQSGIIGQLQIKYTAAYLTTEMGVGLHIGIIPLNREGHSGNRSLVCQQV